MHLKPSLGITKLDRVSALQVQSLYRSKLDSGLSPRTVQIIHATLYKALKQAVKWTLLPRNVADSVDPPKAPKKEIKPLSEEQVKRLLKAAQGDKLEALYVLAITTGMRSGELLGLQWKDVDLPAGIVQVRRTVFNGRIEAPKSAKGNRSIKLTETSIRALREHERTSEWVFCTNVGTTISVHNLHNRSWKPGGRDLPKTKDSLPTGPYSALGEERRREMVEKYQHSLYAELQRRVYPNNPDNDDYLESLLADLVL